MKVGMVSLGCAKNRVDAEHMLGLLARAGHEIISDASDADAIIINTCGFIQSAKVEAIDAIFEMDGLRKPGAKIIVAGCLAQRNSQEILGEMPEVDAIVGIGEIGEIVSAVERTVEGRRFSRTDKAFAFINGPRLLTTSPSAVYLKIADGCDNRCAYCAIPGIRGPYISRGEKEIIEEARSLIESGAKEITLIAQDTTRYGQDIYGEPSLGRLLVSLRGIGADVWWRVLYLYPEIISERLLDTMAEDANICRYIDVPIQHINEEILTRMNRRGGRGAIGRMYRMAKDRGFTLRTTVLVGFPGETREQFEELMSFLRDHPFDRLGAFAYSLEEDTPAADMPGQVPEIESIEREEEVMRQQEEISERLLKKRVGGNERVLLEGMEGQDVWIARSQNEAPEIDGVIFVRDGESARSLVPGDWADVNITASTEHDLEGQIL